MDAPAAVPLATEGSPVAEESAARAGQVQDDRAVSVTAAEDAGAGVLERKRLAQLLTFWRPGSCDWTWAEEYADLIDDPAPARIRERVAREGFGFADDVAPIHLGGDGRVLVT